MLTIADRERFARALEEMGIHIFPATVLDGVTTLSTFALTWGAPQQRHRAANGVEIHHWRDLRERESHPLSHVYAADFGAASAFYVRN